MQKFLIALQFLTSFPVKLKGAPKNEDFGASLVYFPLVGFFIGLMAAAITYIFWFLPYPLISALVVIALILITGGIHLDGLADTCDGFYGSRDKEKMLAIMRDSRIGVMGVIGIVSVLLLKFTTMTSIPRYELLKTLILACVFSRWAQALSCNVSRYARTEGKAAYFIKYARKIDTIVGGFFVLALFLILLGFNGFFIFLSAVVIALLFINYSAKKIGGMTGDTIGAVNEIAEVSILFFSLLYMML